MATRISGLTDTNATPQEIQTITDFSKCVADTLRNKLYFWGAGHGGSTYNGWIEWDLKTGLFSILHGASTPANRPDKTNGDPNINPDGTKVAVHTYGDLTYIPAPIDKVFCGGAFRETDSGGSRFMSFDPKLAQGDNPSNPAAPWDSTLAQPPSTIFLSVWDPVALVMWAQHDDGISYYDPFADSWSSVQHGNVGATTRSRQTFMIDPLERKLWMVGNGTRVEYGISDINSTTRNGSASFTNENGLFDDGEPGIFYHPGLRRNLIKQPETSATSVFSLNGSNNTITEVPVQSGNSVTPGSTPNSSGYWKFNYFPDFDVCTDFVADDESIKTIRIAQFGLTL
jgi:hypothetical protein